MEMASMNRNCFVFIFCSRNMSSGFILLLFYCWVNCLADSLINSLAVQENKIRRVLSLCYISSFYLFLEINTSEKRKFEQKTVWSVSAPLSSMLVAVSVSRWTDTYRQGFMTLKVFFFFFCSRYNERLGTIPSVHSPRIRFFFVCAWQFRKNKIATGCVPVVNI